MSLPILLVDDNPDSCATAAKLLCAGGYQAEVAHDYADALRHVSEKPYSLAIIDYHLADRNGVALFRQMRQLRPQLTGIFLTGYPLLVEIAPEEGIVEVLSKPVDFNLLIKLLEEYAGPPRLIAEST